jgi:hypothetical protein
MDMDLLSVLDEGRLTPRRYGRARAGIPRDEGIRLRGVPAQRSLGGRRSAVL